MHTLSRPYGSWGDTAAEPFELDADAKRVRRYLESTFIEHGRAPTLAAVASELGLSRAATRQALSLLERGVQVMFVPGTENIVKVPPFSTLATRHAVEVDGSGGWFAGCAAEACAIDALFPGREVAIRSACPDCWQPIEIVMSDRRVRSLRPETAVVHWGLHPRHFSRDWLATCEHINFFVDTAHARAWEAQLEHEPGLISSVELTVRSVDNMAAQRHWDYDRGPEIFPPGGGPLIEALAGGGIDVSIWAGPAAAPDEQG